MWHTVKYITKKNKQKTLPSALPPGTRQSSRKRYLAVMPTFFCQGPGGHTAKVLPSARKKNSAKLALPADF
jgi:hypothetical protein